MEFFSIPATRQARNLRVDTLVRLRWLAVLGQTLAVVGTAVGLGFKLPLVLCALVITASAWVNLGLRVRYSRNDRLGDAPAAALLAYDILQLSALLFLTGGLENPFALLFLAPVLISSVSLPPRYTILVGLLAIVMISLLTVIHWPLPWYPGQSLELPQLYVRGVWAALVLGSIFIGVYANRVAVEAHNLAEALAVTELALEREQHLTQLDGLAAAAAHELGTPLATITLAARELRARVTEEGPVREDILLIGEEIGRCRAILGKLASLHSEPGLLDRMSVSLLLAEVVNPQRDFGIDVNIAASGEGKEPVCERNAGVIYGIGNLVENALDFARTKVEVTASWSAKSVVVIIADDGPGFLPEVLAQLGEPYVTTRLNRRAKKDEGSGLGLGLFIAKTLLERSGASVTTDNARAPITGAVITIRWPRAKFEALKSADSRNLA